MEIESRNSEYETIISLENVWKRFGVDLALRDITLKLGHGLHLVVGPNGSGKTTLLKLIVGMIKPTKGSVKVFGLDPWKYYYRLRGKIAFAFEGLPLPWWMSGKEFVESVCMLGGYDIKKMVEVSEDLGVTEYWQKSIGSYSSGMKKRLLLLLSFGIKAELYVLDEPFTLIDEKTLNRVIDLMSELKKLGKILLIATHYIPEKIRKEADTIVKISRGSIVG
ncbi:MAG: ABC transporter ATP-binding protein [Thermoproteales archaeon]|nr:ABC transporter ATP-binding protein [Thermoproteales archaeon]